MTDSVRVEETVPRLNLTRFAVSSDFFPLLQFMDSLEKARRVISLEIEELNRLVARIDESFVAAVEMLKATVTGGKDHHRWRREVRKYREQTRGDLKLRPEHRRQC